MMTIQAINTDKDERDRYDSDKHNRQAEGAAGGQRRVPVWSPPITYTNTLSLGDFNSRMVLLKRQSEPAKTLQSLLQMSECRCICSVSQLVLLQNQSC